MNMTKTDYDQMSEKICSEAKRNYHWEQYADMIIAEYEKLIHA